MAIDNDLVLRDGTTELNASEATPTAKDFGGEDLVPMVYNVDVVETVDGTNPTLLVEIQGSDTESGSYTTFCTFESIIAMGQYIKEAITKYRWRRAKTTVGGTNTPSFHGTMIYPVPAGRDSKR